MLKDSIPPTFAEQALWEAILKQQVSIVKKLLNKGGVQLNVIQSIGQKKLNFLHLAAELGDLRIVKSLVEKGVDIFIKDSSNNIPLYYAIVYHHIKIIQYFVHQDSSVLLFRAKNGFSVLHLASHHGHLDSVQYFLEQDPELILTQNKESATPLKIAVMQGHLAIIRYLIVELEHCLPLDYCVFLLHTAAQYGHLHVLQYFIEEKDVDFLAPTEDALFVVQSAVTGKHKKVSQYLAERAVLKIAEAGVDPQYTFKRHLRSLFQIYYEKLIDNFSDKLLQQPHQEALISLLDELEAQLSLCTIRIQALVLVALTRYIQNGMNSLYEYLQARLEPVSENHLLFIQQYSDLHSSAAGELAIPRERRANEGIGYWLYRFQRNIQGSSAMSEEALKKEDLIQKLMAFS